MNTRNALRRLTLPAAVAYVLVTVLTLLARVVLFGAALVADVAERVAEAGDCARLAVQTAPAPPMPARGGAR